MKVEYQKKTKPKTGDIYSRFPWLGYYHGEAKEFRGVVLCCPTESRIYIGAVGFKDYWSGKESWDTIMESVEPLPPGETVTFSNES